MNIIDLKLQDSVEPSVMLYNPCYITCIDWCIEMAKGSSGRLVIEIDPDLKQELYQALGDEGLNLKQWFLRNVTDFLDNRTQPELPLFDNLDYSKEAKS